MEDFFTSLLPDSIYWQTNKSFNKILGFLNKEILSGAQYEQFLADLHQAVLLSDNVEQSKNSIIEVTGEAIAYFYNNSNYFGHSAKVVKLFRDESSLNNSCMRSISKAHYLDIYTKNPEIVKLIILINNTTKKILARALVWDNKYIDRIYFIKNEDVYTVVNYANLKQYLNIYSYGDSRLRNSFKLSYFYGIDISLSNILFPMYPYLDTLSILDTYNKVLTSRGIPENIQDRKQFLNLKNTTGQYEQYGRSPSKHYYYVTNGGKRNWVKFSEPLISTDITKTIVINRNNTDKHLTPKKLNPIYTGILDTSLLSKLFKNPITLNAEGLIEPNLFKEEISLTKVAIDKLKALPENTKTSKLTIIPLVEDWLAVLRTQFPEYAYPQLYNFIKLNSLAPINLESLDIDYQEPNCIRLKNGPGKEVESKFVYLPRKLLNL